MPFVVANRRVNEATLRARYGNAPLLDVTSRGPEPWVRFSPFYPHGGIPVPFSPSQTAMSVEGIWQGLKVFERADVDAAKLSITTMRGIKRSSRQYGAVLGHRAGLSGDELLPYGKARRAIYLPTYRWVLERCLQAELAQLWRLGERGMVVLLDYETNTNPNDLARPLSHAALIVRFLEGTYPTCSSITEPDLEAGQPPFGQLGER